MKKANRAKAKKVVRPKMAARQLWTYVKQELKADEALAAWVPKDASRSTFKIKESAD